MPPPGEKMHIPLVVDQSDCRWQLLAKILKVFELRKTKKIIAKFTSQTAISRMKVVLTSMFFSTKISYVVEELKRREDLRESLGIKEEEVPRTAYIYSFLSRFDLNDFTAMILRVLNSITKKRARNTKLINPSLKPLLFLLHPANRHEAKIFQEVMDEVKRRRIIRKGDVIIMDKGFYAYRNYLVGMNEYRIVPLIFPRNNFDIERLDGMLSYPLSIFDSKNPYEERRRFKALKSKLMNLLQRWQEFKAVRSAIEDVFKLAKSFGLRKLHRYTGRSVYKFAALNVLLIGIVVALGFREKKVLQRLAEM